VSGTITGLLVRLRDCQPKPPPKVEFAFCPAAGNCTPPASATLAADGAWEYTFDFPNDEPAPYGYIYARDPLRGAEAVTWYQRAGGVGPAQGGGHAPSVEGALNVDLPQRVPTAPSQDNAVIVGPALACATQFKLPAGVTRIVDVPLQVTTVVGDKTGGVPWVAPPMPTLRVRVNYDQDRIKRLGLDESRLTLLQLDKAGQWQQLPTLGRSLGLHWIAAPLQPDGSGTATIGLGYGPAQLYLPLIMR
jgi:hypothetical protein